MESESEFIEREQSKRDSKLLRQLKRVYSTGRIGRQANEVLTINGLIEFTRPNERIPYNHFRLTDSGLRELQRIYEKGRK